MIRNFLKLAFIMATINVGCSAQKTPSINNMDVHLHTKAVEDSLLQKLRSENELVIASASENFAWVKSISYLILAQNDNEWKGYVYYKNLMPNNAGSPTSVNAVAVDKIACDALLNYITEHKAWDIKGDSGNGFCANGNKNCNINDAAGARLWLITKTGVAAPSYYAPEFFERCCPDAQRGLFVSIMQKITAIVGEKDVTE
jgi:hypothetical protein